MRHVWQCEFCNFVSVDGYTVNKHEIICNHNPNSKHCYTCKHNWSTESIEDYCTGCDKKDDFFKLEVLSNTVQCDCWEQIND